MEETLVDVGRLVEEFAEVFNPPFFDIWGGSKNGTIFRSDRMISFAPGTINLNDCSIEFSVDFRLSIAFSLCCSVVKPLIFQLPNSIM